MTYDDLDIDKKKTKKNIVKKRDKSKTKNKIYFGKDTHNSIFLYLNSVDPIEKQNLYKDIIFPSFEKLVENLINIHKFSGVEESFEELKTDCITFLFENMGKFDFSRGTNAFSYFNVLAKNWLIIKSKQKAQRTKTTISFDSEYFDRSNEEEPKDNPNLIIYQQKTKNEIEDDKSGIVEILMTIRTMTKNKNELNCINSIVSIFQNIENIDLLNKNAIFLYLREISGLSPKQLTLTIQTIKKYYRRAKLELVKKNEINTR